MSGRISCYPCRYYFSIILHLPTMVISIATAYDVTPIHAIQRKNVNIFKLGCFLQSGNVSQSKNVIGHLKINVQKLVSCAIFHGLLA